MKKLHLLSLSLLFSVPMIIQASGDAVENNRVMDNDSIIDSLNVSQDVKDAAKVFYGQHASLATNAGGLLYVRQNYKFANDLMEKIVPNAIGKMNTDVLYEKARASKHTDTNWLARADNDVFNVDKFNAWLRLVQDAGDQS